MRRLPYLFIVVYLIAAGMLAAYSPDRLSLVIVGCMGVIALASGFYCLAPVISFTNGLRNGQNSIKRAMNAEGGTAWMMALQMDRFFEQKTLDQLFQEYREKVRQQRENGLLISDIDDTVNEDILGLYSWQSVAAQIPGTMTGLGILGTFLGLLMGLRGINFMTVEGRDHPGRHQHRVLHVHRRPDPVRLFQCGQQHPAQHHEPGGGPLPGRVPPDHHPHHRRAEPLQRPPGKPADRRAAGASGNEQILMPQILDGLKKNEFVFFLQPRYELNTRKVIGAEALVRWNHPTLGVISPAVFIPVLESNGYITKLDQYIWEKVCQLIRQWVDQGIRPVPISVNVTKTDVLAMDVADFFKDMLKKYRIPPKHLEIDVSGSAYLEAYGVLKDAVARLQQAGFRVILDGFDGDYIKLSSAGEIGIDQLKLNLRSENLEDKLEVLPAVFNQARTLRLNLLAEGIESMEQLTMLRKCGCTEGQGYFFSRPLSVAEFEKNLKVGQNG